MDARSSRIDYNQCLFERGSLHPNISRKGKFFSGNAYNQMKEKFIKNWKYKGFLGLYSSEDTPNFTNHDISESNM